MTKVAEEYCWAITQAAGRPYCGQSDSAVLEFGFQLVPILDKYTSVNMHNQISTCSKSDLRRTYGNVTIA